jgi:hypothetical protein
MSFLAGRDHAWHERQDAVHHAHHVDAVDPFPVVDLRLPDVAGHRGHAGIVEQQMAGAVFGEHVFGQRFDRFRLGHIGHLARYVGVAEFGQRAIERFLLDIGDHYLRALGEQRAHDGLADAAGTAGDDRNFIFKILHG